MLFDKLTSLWRYEYGEPIDGLSGDQIVLGTHMFHELERLLQVILCAEIRLGHSQLKNYLGRLADPSHHQSLLFEFAPIVRLDSSIKVDYEVLGFGERHTTIYWLIHCKELHILLEVKHRTKDLIDSVARYQAGVRDPDGTFPAPVHDPALLFRSVGSKFLPRNPLEVIQGVWVVTSIQQEESELEAAFAQLDPSRVHFAIFGDWEDDVYMLSNDSVAKNTVLSLLRLRESRRAVFVRNAQLTI